MEMIDYRCPVCEFAISSPSMLGSHANGAHRLNAEATAEWSIRDARRRLGITPAAAPAASESTPESAPRSPRA